MRRTSFGIVIGCVVAAGASCTGFSSVDCVDNRTCHSGGDDGGRLDAADATGDSGPVVPAGCDVTADPKDSAACVDDALGVFVSPAGDDAAPGTKASPVKTITAGLARATTQRPRVYVCAGTYPGDVVIDAGASHAGLGVYGGFDCTSWAFAGAATALAGGATALKIEAVPSALAIQDVAVTASDQAAGSGASSIAVFVNGATDVTFKRVKMTAGAGGSAAPAVLVPATFADATGNNASGSTGGAAKSLSCPGGATTVGGKGGDSGLSGDPGTPGTANGGILGQPCAGTGTGGDGAPGASPAPAAGAARLGTLDTTGWHPEAGGLAPPPFPPGPPAPPQPPAPPPPPADPIPP